MRVTSRREEALSSVPPGQQMSKHSICGNEQQQKAKRISQEIQNSELCGQLYRSFAIDCDRLTSSPLIFGTPTSSCGISGL
ncbi:hypothetical protein T07_6461 [Trichinella nelsoni]|uniref:Uncharacterized protein n=1 Tax=Trichinella nelsoni TaxID=6336 RepID=A0A0V0RJB8_9BILA|nr:hypothetical protein T07_10252 [Trichinella nelsoni]KRX14503.1 hypothetical protein T07_6461 [Trichinella nelsoni]